MSAWSSSKTSLDSTASTADPPAASRGTTASAGHGDSASIGPLPAPRIIGPCMGPVSASAGYCSCILHSNLGSFSVAAAAVWNGDDIIQSEI